MAVKKVARQLEKKVKITLPDGSGSEFPSGVTCIDIAKSISNSLAKAALACTINERLSDLSTPITQNSSIKIHTLKDRDIAVELIRHDCAHIMARAVQELWPDVKVTIGPVIKTGWYYDFDAPHSFSPEDLPVIEKKMREIINKREAVSTEVWERERALSYYKKNNEPYKVKLIEAIPANEEIRMYWHGDWQDLCRGPHLANTGQIPGDCFKLMNIAGAY